MAVPDPGFTTSFIPMDMIPDDRPKRKYAKKGGNGISTGIALEVNINKQTIELDFGGIKLPIRFIK